MKILDISNKEGIAKIKVDNSDDLWMLSRLITKGDIVGSETMRAVKKGDEQESKRKKVYLKIVVEKIEFDGHRDTLKLLGKIIDSQYSDIPNQSHHSISIEPSFLIDIYKKLKEWEVGRLKDAEAAAKQPKVLLCAADYGDAQIALAKQFGIVYLTEISKSIPGKKKEAIKEHEKAKEEFIKELLKALGEAANSRNVPKIIIGGMGFFTENVKKELSKFPDIEKKVIFTKISSTGRTGINEIIKRGVLKEVIKSSRVDEETKIIEKFFGEVAQEGLAVYGIEEVRKAVGYSAIETLIVSDEYIEALKEKGAFEELEELMDQVESSKGRVVIVSSTHESGERFSKMEVGAMLKFKV